MKETKGEQHMSWLVETRSARSILVAVLFAALALLNFGCASAQPEAQGQPAHSASEQAQNTPDSQLSKDSDKASTQKQPANKDEEAQQDSPQDSSGEESAAAERKASSSSGANDSKKAAPAASSKKQQSSKKSSSGTGASSSKKTDGTDKRTWVDPVYKNVHHDEEGHYETQTIQIKKVRCNCGKLFSTSSEWKAHQDAFIQHMRETVDPNYVCKGDHLSHYVTVDETKQVYVVDKEAYDEKVLVKKGYWK